MSGLAPRAPGDSVRPRRLMCASGRPLNFTVRRRVIQRSGTDTAGISAPLVLQL